MTYPVPQEYERQRSRTVSKRSNTGATYEEVNRHGRAYVGGSLDQRSTTFIGPIEPHRVGHSRERITRALETAPVTTSGYRDAIAIGRLTDFLYPDLPRLVGADTIAYEEQQGENILSSVRALARPPRLTLGASGRIPADHVRYDHECLAPTDDGRIFIGHGPIVERRKTVQIEKQEEQQAREAQRKHLPERIPLPTAIAVLATGLQPGESAIWSHRAVSGTVSRSKGNRYSATVSGQAVRSQRTVKGLQRQITALTA
jgi:hypothetical protein